MYIPTPKDLATFCVETRKRKKLSQAEIGSRVGLKQTTVSKFELKPETTKLDTLFRIFSALDLQLEVFDKQKSAEAKESWKEEW